MQNQSSSRRKFLAGTIAWSACALPLEIVATNELYGEPIEPAKQELTGNDVPALRPFDQLLLEFVDKYEVPGISLAIARHGKLIYARGCGLADRDKQLPVVPSSLFRIASVSKPITAVAIMQLVERQQIELDAPVCSYLPADWFPTADSNFDKRWQEVTVRHCLQHTAGWDQAKSYEPVARTRLIAAAMNAKLPLTSEQIVRYTLTQSLDYDPGSRYAYSNLGYLILGRIIEQVTSQKYEAYCREHLFQPLGIDRMQLGRALPENRAAEEVCYYDSHKRTGYCLYPPHQGEQVAFPDGAESFEAFEAHGGWISSASDLVRFAAAFDNPAHCPLLKPEQIAAMWQRPAGAIGLKADGSPKDAYYGCGWLVRPADKLRSYVVWHSGYIAGSEALLVRRHDGLVWAVLMNTADDAKGQSLASHIDSKLHQAAAKVSNWPAS